jgi:IclR family acetate operon transcriptional repressor
MDPSQFESTNRTGALKSQLLKCSQYVRRPVWSACMAYSRNHSLAKAFSILEVLNGAHGGLTASEVAAQAGLPVTTTHRFLQNLAQLGYVALDPDCKRYDVGFSLTLFGNRRLIIRRIANRSEPFLCELTSQTGLAAYLGSLEGPHAVVEQRALPPRASKGAHAIGTRLDAHAHSIGKVLLALIPGRELLRIYEVERLRVHTGHTIARRDLLLREITAIAADGYAVDNEELNPGVRSLACALLNPKGRAMCAIALEGPRHRLGPDRLRALLPILFAARDKIMQYVR